MQEKVSGISIQSGENKSTLDASAANGVILIGGTKNNKFIASGGADSLVYTGGKDVIEKFNAASDQISLSGGDLTKAKISKGSKSVKFKFGNKNALAIKSDSKIDSLTVDGQNYTFSKNAIAKGDKVTLTSEFSGTYKVAGGEVDGRLVEKNLTFKGTSTAESLIGGKKSTTFKGGGGADTLVGGTGKDIFFYAKGDTGNVTVLNFDYANDKINIKRTLSRVTNDNAGLKFEMDSGNSLTLSTDNLKNSINASNVLIKTDSTLYWFESDGKLYTSSNSSIKNQIRSVMRSKSNYNIVDLNCSTNLLKKGIATASETITFNASRYAKK
mgnify:CR=1 FL=1